MRKYGVYAVVIALFLCVFTPQVQAAEEKQWIFDYAGALSDSELERLESEAAKMVEKKGLDIVVLFVNDGYNASEMQDLADDFYDEHAYGYEEPHGTGVLLAVDINSRRYHISTSGGAEDYFTNSRLDDLEDAFVPALSDSDWAEAAEDFIDFMNQFRNPNLPITMQDRLAVSVARLPFYLVIAAGGSGIIVWIMVKKRANKVTVNSNTYMQPGSFSIVQQDDLYLREYTTRTRIPKNPPNRGGGGGGGHHVSSGGFSHGGRGGSF